MKSQPGSGRWAIVLIVLIAWAVAVVTFGWSPVQWFREVFSWVSRADQALVLGVLLIVASAVIVWVGQTAHKRIASRNLRIVPAWSSNVALLVGTAAVLMWVGFVGWSFYMAMTRIQWP
jgi:hypothetical protein